jgi:hypothetical protein
LTEEQLPELENWEGLIKNSRNFEIDLNGWFIINELGIGISRLMEANRWYSEGSIRRALILEKKCCN